LILNILSITPKIYLHYKKLVSMPQKNVNLNLICSQLSRPPGLFEWLVPIRQNYKYQNYNFHCLDYVLTAIVKQNHISWLIFNMPICLFALKKIVNGHCVQYCAHITMIDCSNKIHEGESHGLVQCFSTFFSMRNPFVK
jgi:hypothetical protein